MALVLTESYAILQGDEGDGACDSYALGRVCDSAAVDHEPFTDAVTVLSKTMDYKKGHDAGFAAVCAPSFPVLACPRPPASRQRHKSAALARLSARMIRARRRCMHCLCMRWVPCGEAIACMISALDHASRFRPQLTGLVAACLWFRAHIGARS